MVIKWRYLAFGAVLFLVGCAQLSKEQIMFNSWASACDSYATSLVALAPSVADGSLSDAKLLVIEDAQELVGPNCREGSPLPDLTGTPTQLIQDILLRLQGLEV